MKEYNKDNSYSNDNKLFHVLQQFTQYEARMYEQAIIHSVEPALNVGQEVSFNGILLKNLLIIEIQHQFKLSLVILIKSMIFLQFVEQDNC